MTRKPKGSVMAQVLALCDGSLSAPEIAARTGIRPEYVRTVLQRNPEALVRRDYVRRVRTDNHLPMLKQEAVADAGVRVPPMSGPVYRAIRDRAEALGISYDDICRKLLSVAVEVGDLDTHFPVRGAA